MGKDGFVEKGKFGIGEEKGEKGKQRIFEAMMEVIEGVDG